MSNMICLHGLTPEQEERIRAAAPEWSILFGRPNELDRSVYRDAEVILGWCGTAAEECLQQDSKLRWVQLWSSGADYMPFAALQEKGIMLTDAGGVHPVPMAETVFAMLLAFTRGLPWAIRNQQQRSWNKEGHFTELTGKTIGIIGVGHIGTEIARLAQAFGMRVIGVRRSKRSAPYVEAIYSLEELDKVLEESDVVVNVLPKTDRTLRLFDEVRFAAMKAGALFINVGRGTTVETDALVRSLQEGHLGGAGLDVFDIEPLPEDHPLWSMDNVIITPHIGGNTDQLKERVTALFIENLQTYLTQGEPARNVVNYDNQY
ncbi:D-2-hydroxyacid dehydrogenase [Paenibacillus sp. MER TA 81-3]|uniref:D-2-hydroxyacid dehydrogenase n=1 Tax=Paenibacillus sp. MER TA 81-3 TaxID=2939573 RepID=UPI00203BC47C|nr:D-2-hydroxyacid dehydrogenase [Paenibacillus sp. MER TA 81-3]MCM3341387.1 D-2-hydroxyacid dehydrogenase [Paenibacillus sp. MER TA 81-3]